MNFAHAAQTLFGGDARDVARRAIHDLVDDRVLTNVGLRRDSGGGAPFAWLAVGAAIGVGIGAVAMYLWARSSAPAPAPASVASDPIAPDNGAQHRGSARPHTAQT